MLTVKPNQSQLRGDPQGQVGGGQSVLKSKGQPSAGWRTRQRPYGSASGAGAAIALARTMARAAARAKVKRMSDQCDFSVLALYPPVLHLLYVFALRGASGEIFQTEQVHINMI